VRKGDRGIMKLAAMTARESGAVAWIDYSKAYDRVPQGWLREVLKARLPKNVRKCIRKLVPLWKTVITVPVRTPLRGVSFKKTIL